MMQYLIIATLVFSPLYAWRFSLFNLPLNFLMLWVFLVWLIFFIYLIAKKQWVAFMQWKKNLNKKILLFVLLFFLSGLISLFINGFDRAKLGQFLVLFLQPISIFFIFGFLFKEYTKSKNFIVSTFYFLLAAFGLFAVIQYFTLWCLPPEYWGNSLEPKRAVSFFTHPNFYALFSAPLLALLIPDVIASLKPKNYNLKAIFWLLGAIGLLLSMSRAGWLGLAAAVFVYLIFAADKKIRQIMGGIIIIAIIVIALTPNLRWRFVLPFYGEKSASSRLDLWQSGVRAIKTSPIFGLGLNGYANNYQKIQTDKTLDTHNYPHNIFLDLWVETGIIGLISLTGLMSLIIYRGLKNRGDIFKLGASLFLIALLTQGLIDNPYFKNDLAMVFWIILSLTL